jgi:2Fe-2S ferredoxin
VISKTHHSSLITYNSTVDDIINIKVTDREGIIHDLQAPTDMAMSLMEVCKAYSLPVEGTCGGMALCASCHVYVQSDHALHQASEDEENMLDQAFFVKSNSRLGCQIKMADDLEGLEVCLAPVGE